MASRIGMSLRNEKAGERIDQVLQLLADHLSIEIPPVPAIRNDLVLQETFRLEWSADVLERIAVSVGAIEAPASSIEDLKRPELNALAVELGIEAPEKLKNKDEVIAAIEQAMAEATDESETESEKSDESKDDPESSEGPKETGDDSPAE